MTEELRELTDPITGEIVDPSDVDQLAEAIQRCSAELDRLHKWHWLLRSKLAEHAPDTDTKTRRVRGRRYRVVLTFPDSSWDQSILKEAWNAYPKYRDQLLRIGRIEVKKRELKKVKNESGPPDWTMFRDMVLRAERPPTSPPSVKIEQEIEQVTNEPTEAAQAATEVTVKDVWGVE